LQGAAAAASGLLFSAAARKQLPLPVPYDLTDLRTVFGAAIKARGGELSETFPSSGSGSSSSSSGSVKTICNNLALNTFAAHQQCQQQVACGVLRRAVSVRALQRLPPSTTRLRQSQPSTRQAAPSSASRLRG
jgi:hypothetical protein